MASQKRLRLINRRVKEIKEDLFNRIAKRFGAQTQIFLVSQEKILFGAQGAYCGAEILINKDLPLFWQLIILEHELGHFFSLKGKPRPKIVHRFHTHRLSSEEKRAWHWVEENPVVKGGLVDREVRRYIRSLHEIARKYGNLEYVMKIGWWY